MHPVAVLKILALAVLANSAPVIAKKIFGNRFAWPLDGGLKLRDGRPLFGASKTIRGLALAVLVTSAAAPLVGLEWETGAAIGTAAMAGDLLSSFVKRRMKLPSSSQAVGLDQIPESLFPLLACGHTFALTPADIAVGVAAFFAGELLLSRLLYRFRLRDRPY
jgi:hypothetical protein